MMMLATHPVHVVLHSAGKPFVYLRGEESPDRIITACVGAMFRARVANQTIAGLMDDADRAESFVEVIEICNRHCTLLDS